MGDDSGTKKRSLESRSRDATRPFTRFSTHASFINALLVLVLVEEVRFGNFEVDDMSDTQQNFQEPNNIGENPRVNLYTAGSICVSRDKRRKQSIVSRKRYRDILEMKNEDESQVYLARELPSSSPFAKLPLSL